MQKTHPFGGRTQGSANVKFLHLHVKEIRSQTNCGMIHLPTDSRRMANGGKVISLKAVNGFDQKEYAKFLGLVAQFRQLINEQLILLLLATWRKTISVILNQGGRHVHAGRA